MDALTNLLGWFLGAGRVVSPVVLMVVMACVTVALVLLLRHLPLKQAQDELRGTSRFKEAQVIRTFFAQRQGLWWKAVLIWAGLWFLSVLVAQALIG